MKKKNIGLFIILILVVIMLGTYVKQQIEDSQKIAKDTVGTEVELKGDVAGLNKGETPPNFTLTTLDGQTVTLSDLKGKKVMLNFWATWCPPCKAEMPHMQSYYEDYAKEKNIEIVAVNATKSEKSIDHVKEFASSYDISFPIAIDEGNKVNNLYKVVSIPSTYFNDSEGYVQHYIIGPVDEEKIDDYFNGMK